jgi:dienelactone hydrolase
VKYFWALIAHYIHPKQENQMSIRKGLIAILIALVLSPQLKSQKLLIDSTAYGPWPTIQGQSISNDGNFICFNTHEPIGNHDTLFIRPSSESPAIEIADARTPIFTQDSKKLIFQKHDSIFIFNLRNSQVKYLESIDGGFSVLNFGTENNLLVYKEKKAPTRLIVVNVNTNEQRIFPSPQTYWYDTAKCAFIFQMKENDTMYHLTYTKFNDGNVVNIWSGSAVKQLQFDATGSQIAYLTENGHKERAIWYCRLEGSTPTKLLDDTSPTIDKALKIERILGINNNNNKVFFSFSNRSKPAPPLGVDVWNYKDAKLQSQQLNELQNRQFRFYMASIDLTNGEVFRLQDEGCVVLAAYSHSLPNNWAIVLQLGTGGDYYNEWNWNNTSKGSVYLLSLKDHSRRLIYEGRYPYQYFDLSPDEKYVIFYDPRKSSYCSFEIATGSIRNITKGITTSWTNQLLVDEPTGQYSALPIGGFTKDNRYALVYDWYDIYQVDLTGRTNPIKLTKGYGRARHIVLRLAPDQGDYDKNKLLLLEAFNQDNKDEGYYRIMLDKPQRPDSLTMQPFMLVKLTKSRDANVFWGWKGAANSYPNLFFSKDLQHLITISHQNPENKYNWLTTELVTWHLADGRTNQGILYKPENFDPHKRYPLIIHYYEQFSDNLHSFHGVSPSNGDINIPFFVSNGYLVFTPDIHFRIGAPGKSALLTVVSAAKMLSKRPYVNAKQMGLQGSSFGGFQTNYIISHTDLFVAAISTSGMSDFISIYGSIIGDGTSRQRQYEMYRDRMGTTLWQAPNAYIENSPVLRANRIKTPLLMMANKEDKDVPYQQGIELFTALRRLGKKAWMLQYDGQGHGLLGEVPQKDLSLRMFQFFNFFLKGELPPRWMTVGIPATQKGIDKGFELDTSGARP